MRILVVDDDRAVRESLRRSLTFNGYTVDLAVDGLDALEQVAAARPDALVLDVMMPRLDGLEVLDPVTREVSRAERSISLTRTEFSLLEMLMTNPRRVLTRSRILEEVWGYDFPTSGNALEVYVGYLRRKTEAEGESRLIHTVRGVGYVLRETPP
jgi:DNA-binding response OmpR family regulator